MQGAKIRSKRVMVWCNCLITILFVLLTACGREEGSHTEERTPMESQLNETGGPVSIDMFVAPQASIVDLNTNEFTVLAEKQFGIDFQFDIAPISDADAKRALLLNSGNYPSVFWSGNFSTIDIQKYGKQGTIIPLNDLIDKFAPNVKSAIENEPGVKEIAVAPDGNIYGLPAVNWCLHCFYAAKLWVNTKMLEKYGLEMPTTTEEFKDVLQVFQSNGMIPLTGVTDGWNSDPVVFLMNAFAYNDAKNYYHVEQGKLKFSPESEGWRNGLRYLHELYQKGLLDNQSFSQKNETLIRLVAQDKVGFVAWGAPEGFIPNGSADPNYLNWKTLPPLQGPSGTQFAAFFGTGYGSAAFAITNKASLEQQEAIMKFMNFVWTEEGTQTMDFGPEGKFWTKAKPGDIGLDGNQALFDTAWNSFYAAGAQNTSGWDQMGPMFQSKKWRNGGKALPPQAKDGLATILRIETLKNYVGLQPREVYPAAAWVPEEDVSDFSMLRTNINKYVEQSTAEFIVGTKNPEKDWDAYIDGLQKLGLEEYMKMSQNAMKEPFDTSEYTKDPTTVELLESLK